MKTFLAIIGALTLFVIVAAGLAVGFSMNMNRALAAQAGAFADETLAAIIADWDGEEIRKRAAPELLEAATASGGVEELMTFGQSELGAALSRDPSECEIVHFNMGAETGETVVAACAASVLHEYDAAIYDLSVVKRDGDWSLLGFFITPAGFDAAPDADPAPIDDGRFADPGAAQAAEGPKLTVSLSDGSIDYSNGGVAASGAGLRAKIDNLP